MSYLGFLQSLGPRHLFSLSNEGTSTVHDRGNGANPTSITGGTYSFAADPVCYGATHCLRSTSSTSTGVDGAVFDNRADINGSGAGSYDWNDGTRSVILWCRQSNIWNPTCIHEAGGGVNNLTFMGGAQNTWQAADAGQPFLIVAGKTLAKKDRPILHVGIWEYHTQHAGAGNRVLYYENGVLQGIDEQNGTATFPGHSGDIVVGNSSDNLKSFNETTFSSQTVAKDCNWLGMWNNISLTEAQCREMFERAVRPEVLIDSYSEVNCAIEIRQATDATDYTLTLDNIQFVQNQNLRDIAVKYVGPHTLTLINNNGSDAEEVCAPVELDIDGSTIIPGGGSIVIVNPATIALTGLKDDTEVRMFAAGTGTELAGQEIVNGGSFSASIQEPSIDIVVMALGYQNLRLTGVDTTGGDLTIPIQQQLDRQYLNP